jgi:hypothetical protein
MMESFVLNPLVYAPPLRIAPSCWLEHVPFAMHLVDLLRPRTVVELGVHYGVSYCAFCQAIRSLGLEARCAGIDTWTGDEQSYFYGPEVLEDLSAHHDPLYGSFSRLHQTTFDEARALFESGTIDLLHIDGCHTYDAVKHDFEAWLPKISDRGVVVLHDTNVRRPGFCVWILWQELQARYPHFEFFHEHGLGILGVGQNQSPALKELFEANDEPARGIREFFSHVGGSLRTRERLSQFLSQEQHSHSQERLLRDALELEQAARQEEMASYADETTALREALNQLLSQEQHWHSQERQLRDALEHEQAQRQEETAWHAREAASLREALARNQQILTLILQSRAWRVVQALNRFGKSVVPERWWPEGRITPQASGD